MTTLNPASALFLSNVNRIEQQIAQASEQISSGRKINVAADAPDQIGSLLQLRSDQQRNTQIQSNLALAQTDASAADGALSSSISLMDRAIQLAAQGGNTTQTAETRTSLAQVVASLQAQMVAYSQTQVQGRHIFSGDQDSSPTYQLNLQPPPGPPDPNNPAPMDPAALTGVDLLTNAPATRQIEDPAGGTFAAGKTAQEIFDNSNADGTPAADNVFAALNSLRLGLLTNDQTAIGNSIASLKAASTHLNDMQAFYGSVEGRIRDAGDFATRYGAQLRIEISNIEDADVTTAALVLTQANTQLQAAFEMQGKMPRQTLFDFLG